MSSKEPSAQQAEQSKQGSSEPQSLPAAQQPDAPPAATEEPPLSEQDTPKQPEVQASEATPRPAMASQPELDPTRRTGPAMIQPDAPASRRARTRMTLRIPDDAVPVSRTQSSPDLEAQAAVARRMPSSPDLEAMAGPAAMIRAMRIIAVGEAQPPPPRTPDLKDMSPVPAPVLPRPAPFPVEKTPFAPPVAMVPPAAPAEDEPLTPEDIVAEPAPEAPAPALESPPIQTATNGMQAPARPISGVVAVPPADSGQIPTPPIPHEEEVELGDEDVTPDSDRQTVPAARIPSVPPPPVRQSGPPQPLATPEDPRAALAVQRMDPPAEEQIRERLPSFEVPIDIGDEVSDEEPRGPLHAIPPESPPDLPRPYVPSSASLGLPPSPFPAPEIPKAWQGAVGTTAATPVGYEQPPFGAPPVSPGLDLPPPPKIGAAPAPAPTPSPPHVVPETPLERTPSPVGPAVLETPVIPVGPEPAAADAVEVSDVEIVEETKPQEPKKAPPPAPPPGPRSKPAPKREQPPVAPSVVQPSQPPRARVRTWWEDLFTDDFVRSMDRLTADQVKREVKFIEESLAVQKGGVMLDLGCGAGQHAVELAARGYNVVGYDLSLTMLALAADEAQARGQKLNFLQGDMKEMAFEDMFDGVFSWSTSFGYFDHEKNCEVIRRVQRALRTGGMFLLDIVNRDYLISRTPSMGWFEGDGCVCMDEAKFDSITSRLLVKRTLMLDDGRSREIEFSIRLYALHEIGKMVNDAGFKVVEVSGHPATAGVFMGAESPRLITLAEKR